MKKSFDLMTPYEKKKDLFFRQKHTLDLFLERKAITPAQYQKSLNDMTEKMEMQSVLDEILNGGESDE